jgi:hypothetical protein
MEFPTRLLCNKSKEHLGDLIGSGLKYIWFDRYEAGTPTWMPRMHEEFQARRGCDLTSFFSCAHEAANWPAQKNRCDFQRTVHNPCRRVYFGTIQ